MFKMFLLGIWKTRTLMRVKHHNLIYSSAHHGDHQHTDDVSSVYSGKLKKKKKWILFTQNTGAYPLDMCSLIMSSNWFCHCPVILFPLMMSERASKESSPHSIVDWEKVHSMLTFRNFIHQPSGYHILIPDCYQVWCLIVKKSLADFPYTVHFYAKSANDPDFNKTSKNEAIPNQALYFKSLIKMTAGLLLILCLMERTKNSQRVNPFAYFRHLFYNRINYFWRCFFLSINRI